MRRLIAILIAAAGAPAAGQVFEVVTDKSTVDLDVPGDEVVLVSVYLDTQGATDAPWDRFYGWSSCAGFLACNGGTIELPVEFEADISSGAWLGRRPPDALPSAPGDDGGFRGFQIRNYVESTGDETGHSDLAGFDSVLSERVLGRAIEPWQLPVILSGPDKNTDGRVEVLRTLVTFTEPGAHDVVFRKRDAILYTSPDLLDVLLGAQGLMETIDAVVLVETESPHMVGIVGNRDPVIHGQRFRVSIDEVIDLSGDVRKVRLLRDVNHNGRLDPHDELVGKDKSGADVWAISALSDATWGTARTCFFAEAVDVAGNRSNVLTAQTDVIAPGVPYIQELTSSSEIVGPYGSFQLRARGVVDTDGTIAEVRFYRDADADGLLGAGDQLLGVQTETLGFGFEEAVFWPSEWGTGLQTFFARATDDLGTTSLARSVEILGSHPRTGVRWSCPADRNGDGWVSAGDLALFLNAYTERDPSADVDGLPGVDQLDVIEFVQLWNRGCN